MRGTRTLLAILAAVYLVFTLIILPAHALALPVIQELLYDGVGADSDEVFTEIFGTAGMLFDGWHLVGINGGTGEIYRTIDLSGALIPADGILLIATADAVGEVLANRDFVANVDWQNGPDAVQLLNPAGEVIDALQYGDAKNNNAGEGTPAVDVSAGWSLARFPFAFDSGDNFADFQATEFPTPGTGLEPVPEPGTMMLLGAGLLGLAAYGRRSLRQDA